MFDFAYFTLFNLLTITIVFHVARGKYLTKLRCFYSYVHFSLLSGIALKTIHVWRPDYFASPFWIQYMMAVVVEFVVLVEASDKVFAPQAIT